MKCFLCKSFLFWERPGCVRDAKSIKILECQKCSLVQLSSRNHIEKLHYEKSKMHGERKISLKIWLDETKTDDHRRFQDLRLLLSRKSLLDFGCGAGGFLNLARKISKNAMGIEPEERVIKKIGTKLKIVKSLKEINQKFDLITAFHVFEHLKDPRSTLKNLANRLKASGKIIIEVPNADDALLTLYKCKNFQKFAYWSNHLFVFNTKALKLLVGQCGLKVSKIQYIQRYPLSNHLYWLSHGKPGGHKIWKEFNAHTVNKAYSKILDKMGLTDTIMLYLTKK